MNNMWIIEEISISKLLQTLSNRKKGKKGHAWPQRDGATETRTSQGNVAREDGKERMWIRKKKYENLTKKGKKLRIGKPFHRENYKL